MYFIIKHACTCVSLHAGVSPSAVASFNDTRCASGGVCSTDPLFFTCGLKEVAVLRVLLPTGYKEVISLADTTDQVALPAGFMAVSLSISILDTSRRNIFVKISIANASLLDGGEIVCDDTTGNNVTAGCPLLNGKSQQRIEEKRNGDIYLHGWDCRSLKNLWIFVWVYMYEYNTKIEKIIKENIDNVGL